jgi:hypothetical protein
MALPIILAAISAAISLGKTIYGGVKSAQARKQQEQLLARREAENKAWYNANALGDYTKRQDVQNLMRQLRQQLKDQNRTQANMSVVTGATPEQQVAQKEASNRILADAYGNIAARGQQYKDRVTDRYLAMKQGYDQVGMGMLEGKAVSYENLMNGGNNSFSGSMGSLMGALGSSNSK